MEIEVRGGKLLEQEVDALIVPVGPGVELGDDAAAVDGQLDGGLKQVLESASFSGKPGSTQVIPTMGRIGARWVVATGVGPTERRGAAETSRAWSVAARAARAAGARSIAGTVADAGAGIDEAQAARAAVEGAILGLYRFREFKTGPATGGEIERVVIAGDPARLKSAVARAEATAAGVVLARDLGNQPPDAIYPESLAEAAGTMAAELGLGIQVYGPTELQAMGAGALLGVGKGSAREPRLIHLSYTPRGASQGTIGFVGKAITFDSGGLNLKPSGSGIERMKIDMAGGAAVIGAMSVLPALGLPLTVHGVVASAENMISSSSYRPGDILRAMNGKTIEITNTDAEGRLVLADALTYTARQGAEAMIDLATLTGANVVALGDQATGVYSNDQALADQVLRAARSSGELMWQMPLWEAYEGRLKGDFADLRNSGTRDGGAIFAALFLREFVDGVAWAHLDIAGPAYASKVTDLSQVGATGHAVRTLVALLEERAG